MVIKWQGAEQGKRTVGFEFRTSDFQCAAKGRMMMMMMNHHWWLWRQWRWLGEKGGWQKGLGLQVEKDPLIITMQLWTYYYYDDEYMWVCLIVVPQKWQFPHKVSTLNNSTPALSDILLLLVVVVVVMVLSVEAVVTRRPSKEVMTYNFWNELQVFYVTVTSVHDNFCLFYIGHSYVFI